ncbi:MAG: aspartate/glutamate racemase family protein [Pseudomonadota bacterium]
MSVVIINPNSTTAMTEAMLAVAQEAAPDVAMEGWTSHNGPPAIQGKEDGLRAEPPLMDLIRQAGDHGARGIIIGCFDDTALAEAARFASCPVVGIGQAAYHFAALRGWRFSVVTTLAVSVPILEQNIHDLGLRHHMGRVRASDVPVLALHEDETAAEHLVVTEAQAAEREDDVDAIILGCAGMAHLTSAVRCAVGVQVIDPVVTAATAMRWLM